MQDPLSVQVAQRGGEVGGEVGQLGGAQRTAALGDEVVERAPGEGLHDHDRALTVVDLSRVKICATP